ncbi:Crp/Fnr family transcriptional regulator [Prosthecomicrobium sp. N25]|uniref:Crp/Fnr family transcriptional regulator n=1 Tax=Prosthecomicrobium sp. N25 TaxID=3129254 RepID=UPI0030787BD7
MATAAAFLGSIPYFTDLPGDLRAAVAGEVQDRRVRQGETILVEGEPCAGLHLVVAGRVKIYKVSPDGREQVLRILGTGQTFNDVPVFDGGPSPGNAAALEDGIVGLIPKATMLRLVHDHPAVAQAVIVNLAARLRAMTLLVEDVSLRGVTARVASLLLKCSRGESALAEDAGIGCGRLTQQDVAAMTGSVREVVQRSLKILERDGAIAMARGSVRVLAPAILETWAGGGSP